MDLCNLKLKMNNTLIKLKLKVYRNLNINTKIEK